MEIFLDKGTIEFLTVASEFCGFVEKANKFTKRDFLGKLHKMISLVYLKASILEPDSECDNLLEEGFSEAFLSEYEYEYIQKRVSSLLGSHDSYINIYNSASNDSEYEQAEISRCIADIYHNLKNFVENCRTGSEDSAKASRSELMYDFREFWGYRCISLLAAIHAIIYSYDDLSDEEEDMSADSALRSMAEKEGAADSALSFFDKFMQTQRSNI